MHNFVCTLAKMYPPSPHNLEKETDTVVSVFSFFFLLYVHKD